MGGDDFGYHALPGGGSEAAAETLPDEHEVDEDEGEVGAQVGQEEGDEREAEVWDTLLKADFQDEGQVAAQARDVLHGEKLRQLPAERVDGGNEREQERGVGELAHEEGDDGDKGGHANAKAEEAAIEHVHGKVAAQGRAKFA